MPDLSNSEHDFTDVLLGPTLSVSLLRLFEGKVKAEEITKFFVPRILRVEIAAPKYILIF